MERQVGPLESVRERGMSRTALPARSCSRILVSQATTSHLCPFSRRALPAPAQPPGIDDEGALGGPVQRGGVCVHGGFLCSVALLRLHPYPPRLSTGRVTEWEHAGMWL